MVIEAAIKITVEIIAITGEIKAENMIDIPVEAVTLIVHRNIQIDFAIENVKKIRFQKNEKGKNLKVMNKTN